MRKITTEVPENCIIHKQDSSISCVPEDPFMLDGIEVYPAELLTFGETFLDNGNAVIAMVLAKGGAALTIFLTAQGARETGEYLLSAATALEAAVADQAADAIVRAARRGLQDD